VEGAAYFVVWQVAQQYFHYAINPLGGCLPQ